MAVSAVIGAIGVGSMYQQNQAQKQQQGQFTQMASMEATRQETETKLAQDNLAQQQAALDAQNAAFAAQQKAAAEAQATAEKQATLADIANNRAMGKAPNIGAMLTGNDKAAASGAGSTLLTGAGGVAGGTLGRANLLGL